MFTGIVESTSTVDSVKLEGENLRIRILCDFANELKVDQSVSHNGVCLTVVSCNEKSYDVVAIHETIMRTNLGSIKKGDKINLERGMKAGDRLDGHIVQGHVDCTAVLRKIVKRDGSTEMTFDYEGDYPTVSKGSICVNGVSLTVVDSEPNRFSVAVIPYTLEHTNLDQLKEGSTVNVEFDIIGKYIEKLVREKIK